MTSFKWILGNVCDVVQPPALCVQSTRKRRYQQKLAEIRRMNFVDISKYTGESLREIRKTHR